MFMHQFRLSESRYDFRRVDYLAHELFPGMRGVHHQNIRPAFASDRNHKNFVDCTCLDTFMPGCSVATFVSALATSLARRNR